MQVSLSLGSDILYHITTITAAENILRANQFELKPAEGSDWEQRQGAGKFYLSTARSKTSAYIRKSAYSYSVVLKLNGKALGMRYKVKAVDYWETNKAQGDQKLEIRKHSNEMEDRVFSNSSTIPKAASYILEVHAHINEKNELLFALKKFCLMRKIPIFLYDDKEALIAQDTRRAKSVELRPTPNKPVSEDDRKYRAMRQVRTFRAAALRKWIELYKKPIGGSLEKAVKELNEDYGVRAYKMLRYSDAINQFKNDLHNAKIYRYGDASKEREYLDVLVKAMRRLKQTPEQFIKMLENKWYKQT